MQSSAEQHFDANITSLAAAPAFLPALNKIKAFKAQVIAKPGGQESVCPSVVKDKQMATEI